MTYKLAIFDFDGTLANSLPWLLKVINTVAARYRFRPVEAHELEDLQGFGPRELLAYIGLPIWKLPLVARHVRNLMGEEIHEIHLYPGVPEMLDRLAERGVEIAIVTSNSEENVRRVLGPRHAELIRHYACKASLFGKRKKLRQVLRATDVPRERIISIGDEVRDIQASHAERLAFGVATWGYSSMEAVQAYGPEEIFFRVEDIPERIT